MRVPTDEHPLDVDGELVLFGKHLTHRGARIPYGDIESLGYSASSQAADVAPAAQGTRLGIRLGNGQSISCGSDTALISEGNAKRIENAYAFLRQITFRKRLSARVRTLETQGFVDIDDVRIFSNGDIERGDARFNLRMSRKNNAFFIGTSGACGIRYPDEVLVGEKGTSMSSKRIQFRLGNDKDVIKEMLEWLSKAD